MPELLEVAAEELAVLAVLPVEEARRQVVGWLAELIEEGQTTLAVSELPFLVPWLAERARVIREERQATPGARTEGLPPAYDDVVGSPPPAYDDVVGSPPPAYDEEPSDSGSIDKYSGAVGFGLALMALSTLLVFVGCPPILMAVVGILSLPIISLTVKRFVGNSASRIIEEAPPAYTP